MKQFVLFFTLIFATVAMHATDEAEYETYRITWDDISNLVENRPDSVKSLIDRAVLGDTTLRTKEVLVAYMGKSFFGTSPFGDSRDARDALNENKIDSAMFLIEKAIECNPLSVSNNYYYIFCALSKNPQITEIKDIKNDEKLRLAFARFEMLLSAIYYSGNGSKEFPYKVISIDDEYTFMRAGLDLPQPTNQTLTNDFHDVFTLPAHSSTIYTGQEIHFDATRIILLEMGLFNPN